MFLEQCAYGDVLTYNVAIRMLEGCVYKREGQWFGEQVGSRPNNFGHNARAQLSFQKKYM